MLLNSLLTAKRKEIRDAFSFFRSFAVSLDNLKHFSDILCKTGLQHSNLMTGQNLALKIVVLTHSECFYQTNKVSCGLGGPI